jgi:hypothetical protein
MADALRLSTIVMLGAGGIFTGGIVWCAWERVLDLAQAHAPRVRDRLPPLPSPADPAMPILLVICGTAASVFAYLTGATARALALAGIELLVLILLSSIIVAEPINSQFRRRPEGVVPPNAEHLRTVWRRFHLVRTGLAVAAFACLVAAVSHG